MEEKTELHIKRVRRLSRLLDAKFNGPFNLKFGLDGIIGLIPIWGDFISTSASMYILYLAHKIGCPTIVLLKMLLNILLDHLLGMIPIFGDITDFFIKSNLKNTKLIEDFINSPLKSKASSYFSFTVVILIFTLIMAAFYFFISWIFESIKTAF